MNKRHVLNLQELNRKDIPLVGGKAAVLGELLASGFPVPPGFVVTTLAYDLFVSRNHLDEVIERALKERPVDGEAIRKAFLSAPIPEEVAQAIRAAYQTMGSGSVAVRSTATAEDMPHAAFAGQHETFLNVVGVDAVVEAVRRCWVSLWDDRAIAYREKMGIDHRMAKMAVIVQRMVPAEASGVMFTANPITGARDEVVIGVNVGLGEAVVSGLVTPDHYVLRKTSFGWRIVERRLGRREVVVKPKADGGVEEIKTSNVTQPVVSDDILKKLADLGVKIQSYFGRPQDIEWALANGEIFILQARPITTLPEPMPRVGKLNSMLIRTLAEIIPERPYPLDMVWIETIFSNAVGKIARYFGIKVPALEQIFVEEDGIAVKVRPDFSIRPSWGVLLAPFRLIWLALRYDSAKWESDPLLSEIQARVDSLKKRDPEGSTWEELLDTVHEALSIPSLAGEIRKRYLPRALISAGIISLSLRTLRRRHLLSTLLFTCINTKVTEANAELEKLAEMVRKNPELMELFRKYEPKQLISVLEKTPAGQEFLSEFEAFLEKYGHREARGSALISHGTWKEEPEVVLGIVASLATSEVKHSSCARFREALDQVLTHPLLRLRPFRSTFLSVLEEARQLHRLREDGRFYAMMPIPILRRALLTMGKRLVEAGVLEVPQDIFYLKLSEIEQIKKWPLSEDTAEELRALVSRRKEKWASLKDKPFIDPRLLYVQDTSEDAQRALLVGIPGSPGVAEGYARIIRDSSEFHKLRPGDVLVAPYTTPAWTPLFRLAVAVVVDTGGPLSHAAIVAREYGIPAVMGAGVATKVLKDGQYIRVDGNRGLVFSVETEREEVSK
ncbi:PEP/pyruvate-binding domain-containing protein [Thermococcus aciditolerans]|uniref:Probable phosphoenolpyruvate synthase n=1 Tax=Thermococcus aciditolerans TaxID=2598455 RepID=A0A5C0SQH0_9EURY|nr:PEP/pyruvate-binding domain-containing protein [Thermococcus aciditolerans]QEK15438.1 phosphoenolpyruvate synthase [Thermococcus aciditolerans]